MTPLIDVRLASSEIKSSIWSSPPILVAIGLMEVEMPCFCYMNISKKVELTASICYIGKFAILFLSKSATKSLLIFGQLQATVNLLTLNAKNFKSIFHLCLLRGHSHVSANFWQFLTFWSYIKTAWLKRKGYFQILWRHSLVNKQL